MVDVPGGKDSKPKVLAKWGGVNTHSDRAAIPEDDFSWLENLMPIAPGNLRTLYAEGTNVYTTINPRTVIALYPYNLAAVAYVALFLDDGSAVQIQVSNGASTTIGAAGTFYSGGTIPACSQYQSKYLIIGSDVTANAYWVWDGAHLFGAGTLSPQVTVVTGGANYASTPTITAAGGSGSGATFSTTIANGQVTDAVCTNGGSGYLINEKVTLSFSGGGSDTEAQAVALIAPYAAALGAVSITNGGSGFTSVPTITISAPSALPATASANATVSGGAVTAVVMGGLGSGYLTTPTVSFSGGGGSGAAATAVIDNLGRVASVTVTAPGTGYGSPPTVTITAPTAAEAVVAAKAIAVVTNGIVTSALVTNPGFGYLPGDLPITATISGGGGTGATALSDSVTGLIGRINVVVAGSGYTSNPAITISAPDNPVAQIPATAQAVASINTAGQVTGITVTNHGAGYLKANVDIRGGNNCAHAEAVLMPFGIQATAIETYNNQVWTTVGTKMSLSGPGTISDFSTFGGGGSAPATDSFLRRILIGLKQDNGFLYRFADSSVNVITNVQTSAAGITTYNNSNVDSQSGTIWRDTICAFDRAIVFASSTGVYALFGGAVQKVSDQLDGIFLNGSFNTGLSGVTPTAAVCTLFGVRCYCLLLTSKDYTGANRTFLCIWNGQRWFIGSQTKTLTLVGLQEIDSVFTAWGTDGTHLFKMFQTPSTGLTKTFQTRLDGAELPDMTWRVDNAYITANLLNGASATVLMSLDTDNANPGNSQTYTLASAGRQIVFAKVDPNGAVTGTLRGFTGTTTAADLQIITIERLESDYSRQT